jgi:hypothetical protein
VEEIGLEGIGESFGIGEGGGESPAGKKGSGLGYKKAQGPFRNTTPTHHSPRILFCFVSIILGPIPVFGFGNLLQYSPCGIGDI